MWTEPHEALAALRQLSEEAARCLIRDDQTVPKWIARAIMKTTRAKLVGLIALRVDDQVRWPAVSFDVTQEDDSGRVIGRAAVALYQTPTGEWEVSHRLARRPWAPQKPFPW